MGSRLPPIPPEQYDEAQKRAAQAFEAARKAPVFGPFEALLYSPELMSPASAMGEYLRYHSGIGTTLSELVILVTAREWTQDYEWHVHAPIAAKAGIRPAIIDAIRDGRRPEGMSDDEALVYDFSLELHRNKGVSDASWARAEQRFGRPALVDLVGINGYYAFLAMQLNASRYEGPKDVVRLPRFPG